VKRITVAAEKCNGCLSCTHACMAAHSASGTIMGALAEGVQARIHVEAVNGRPVPLLCCHCEEPACVDACMTGAMQKDPVSGIVANEGNEQACVGCWMCIMACPYGVIVPKAGEPRIALKCDGCKDRPVPACVEGCPNFALVWEEIDACAAGKRQSAAKELVA
jgi:carbon-monoxide dehydrogenase iron sulfur subunit